MDKFCIGEESESREEVDRICHKFTQSKEGLDLLRQVEIKNISCVNNPSYREIGYLLRIVFD